jgi:hypothetical protein
MQKYLKLELRLERDPLRHFQGIDAQPYVLEHGGGWNHSSDSQSKRYAAVEVACFKTDNGAGFLKLAPAALFSKVPHRGWIHPFAPLQRG